MTMIDLEALGLTPELETMVLDAGTQAGQALTPAKAKRASGLMAKAEAAVKDGAVPPAPTFPVSNYWSQRKADAIHALVTAGDLEGLRAYEVGGTNTYAKALRRYRELCIGYLEAAPVIEIGAAKEPEVDTSDIPEVPQAVMAKAKVTRKKPAQKKAAA